MLHGNRDMDHMQGSNALQRGWEGILGDIEMITGAVIMMVIRITIMTKRNEYYGK